MAAGNTILTGTRSADDHRRYAVLLIIRTPRVEDQLLGARERLGDDLGNRGELLS